MKIKKTITICAILVAIFALSFLGLFAVDTATEELQPIDEQIYYLKAEVYGINQHNVFLLLAEDGNLWEAEELSLREGDELLLMMNNNNTTVRKTDDIIINVYVLADQAQG